IPKEAYIFKETEKLINNIEKINESINGLKETINSKNNEDKIIEGIKNLGNRLEVKITSLGQETEAYKAVKTQLKETKLQLETIRNHLTKEADNHHETKERLATTQCNFEETKLQLETICNNLTEEEDSQRETKKRLAITQNNLEEAERHLETICNDLTKEVGRHHETKEQLATAKKVVSHIETKEQLEFFLAELDLSNKDRERQLESINNNLTEAAVRQTEEQFEHFLIKINLAHKDLEETKRHLTEETGRHLETKEQLTILQVKLDRVNIVLEVLKLLREGKSYTDPRLLE
ncbi:3729_t:CDS:2, partial [Funneliformis caledonium]